MYLTEILNFNFLEIWSSDFSEIFRECRGVNSLSTYKFVGPFRLRKKVTELFSKIFGGTLNLRGDPEPAKVYGGSIEGVEFYKAVKRSQLYLPRNSRYKGSKFDLLGPLAAKP